MPFSLLPLKLIELRKQHNYTQEYVSSYIHISRGGYSQYETGKRAPSSECLLRLAELYNISINQLINPQLISVTDTVYSDPDSTHSIDINKVRDLSIYLLNCTPSLDVSVINQSDVNFLSMYKRLSPEDQEDIRLFTSCKFRNLKRKNKNNEDV